MWDFLIFIIHFTWEMKLKKNLFFLNFDEILKKCKNYHTKKCWYIVAPKDISAMGAQ